MKPSEHRIEWVDIAKGIGIVLVIFAHINKSGFARWIYSFHVPLFFILSGYVFNPKDSFKIFVTKRLKGLLLPYLCFGIIIFLSQVVRKCFNGEFSIHSTLVMCVELAMQIRYSTLWFIAVLFWLNLAFYPIVKYLDVLRGSCIVLFLTVIGIVYSQLGLPYLPWNVDACLVASFFFYVGWLLKHNSIYFEKCLSGVRTFVYGGVFLGINLITYSLNLYFGGAGFEMYLSRFGIAPLTLCAAVSGSLFTIVIAHMIRCTWLRYVGENSLVYYALHQQVFIPLIGGLMVILGIVLPCSLNDVLMTVLILLVMSGINIFISRTKFSFVLGR